MYGFTKERTVTGSMDALDPEEIGVLTEEEYAYTEKGRNCSDQNIY